MKQRRGDPRRKSEEERMSVESRTPDPNQGDMPGAGMDANSPEEQMPSGSMEASSMNAGEMPGSQMEGDEGAPRFVSDSLPPGSRPPAAWEPGVVEVQFRDDVAAQVTRASATAPPEILSLSTELSTVNQVLRRHGVQRVEPTFLRSHEEATAAQVSARSAGSEVPNLSSFVTVHFAPDTDVERVAQELSRLPEVARAVPV